MKWLLIFVVLVLIPALAAIGRRQGRRDAVRSLRTHFAHVARMRLVAVCPGLDGALDEAELRFLFDWILVESYRRTGAGNFNELMEWSLTRGEAETTRLTADIARQAVDRLSRSVLAVIDGCEGRTVAGVILDEALTEAGQRLAPHLKG